MPTRRVRRPATSAGRSRRSGATHAWPVIVDASAAARERVAVGGGAHGVNLHLAPADLVAALAAEVVDVTVPEGSPDAVG